MVALSVAVVVAAAAVVVAVSVAVRQSYSWRCVVLWRPPSSVPVLRRAHDTVVFGVVPTKVTVVVVVVPQQPQ